MKTNPLVTVIIPTYNRAGVLENAVRSALAQTYPHVEIIVVDDGSEDNTSELMQAYPTVRYMLKEHAGQGAARSHGLQHANGTLIASLDSDDIWYPGFLEHCVPLIEDNNLDFVFANWMQDCKDGTQVDFCRQNYLLEPYFKQQNEHTAFFSPADLRRLYIESCLSPSSSLLVRASSMESNWDARMNIADDWCMLLDMILCKECRAAFIKTPLWKKTVSNDNIYDGRSYDEVNRLLYVADAKIILERHRHLLTPSEKQFLENRYLEYLVRTAKNNIRKPGMVKEGLAMIKEGISIHPVNYVRIFSKLMAQNVRRKWNDITS